MTTTLTPEQALSTIVEGALRAQAGQPSRPNTDTDTRSQLAQGQDPFAAVVGCSDSRVPMEYALDAGYGDVFAIRTAGHTLGETVIGSIEFAVAELGVPLVLVLGHTSCGAVTAAQHSLDTGETPGANVGALVERILPSVISSREKGGTTVNEAVAEHSRRTVERLRDLSPVLHDAESAGKLKIVGAVYDLATGAVTVLD
ncbi:MAG: carbonic anhydrase [Galactobacter sp.]|uniref:carbonic anhydrase n=1 Tax=Galactobacter sp. TaxID=2676125 RepID=UPI0025B9157B|nr:carbonic anhydrase [Galactobacter sp.]